MARNEFKLPKGVKDFCGEEAIVRETIKQILRKVFQKYGFNPIETPIFERTESLGFKGGSEIQKEIFKMFDQGKRKLALRFDQTVPLARFIASHPEINMPFKRYAIGPVFRDGPAQTEKGRFRIFTQCDVDIVGVNDMAAEAELFALANDVFKELGLGDIQIIINNRKLLDGILDYVGIDSVSRIQTIITLDKKDKIGLDGIVSDLKKLTTSEKDAKLPKILKEKILAKFNKGGLGAVKEISSDIESFLGRRGLNNLLMLLKKKTDLKDISNYLDKCKTTNKLIIPEESIKKLVELIKMGKTNKETLQKIEAVVSSETGKEGINEVKKLLKYADELALKNVIFDPCLARGLDYYTGTAIEVFLRDKSICPSAILGGGRYDNMVGEFVGDGQNYPAVGFAFGLERLSLVVSEHQKNLRKNYADIFLIPIGDTMGVCLQNAQYLRELGICVDMQLDPVKKIGKSISYADSIGIPYVGLIGKEEMANGSITIKNLKTGNQEKIKLNKIKQHLGIKK